MGQQQLLLLVLGMVIVGIAVVAGIQAFSEGKAKADRDAAVSDAMRLISDIQAWMLKPKAFGGGGDSGDWSNVSFQAIGIPSSSLDNNGRYLTLNGCYALSGNTTAATLTIYSLTTVDGERVCDANTTIATVTIDGTTPDDIAWSYATNNNNNN
ncbi:MAG: hypothetical protein Q9M35_08320 [Rhodothermus sp.]|nr:hypothetical protein [Rhodothermus sp.]